MGVRGQWVSPIETKPATDYRNYPASEFYVRCFKERGIFISNKPIAAPYSGLVWKKNADLRGLEWLGHFDNCWPV
jgi:hypothetical protein